MQRILSILSWVGVVLVFGALVVRFTKPEWDQYATWAAWAGLGLVVLYTLGQWREIAAFFRRRNARYGTIASVSVIVVLGILVADQLPVGPAQQALGPDREQAVQPLGTDR